MKRYNLNVIHTAVWQVEVLAESEEQAKAIAEMRVDNIGLQGCTHHELDCTDVVDESNELTEDEVSKAELTKWQGEVAELNGEVQLPPIRTDYTEDEIKGMTIDELDQLPLSVGARVRVQLAWKDEGINDEEFIERYAEIAVEDLRKANRQG